MQAEQPDYTAPYRPYQGFFFFFKTQEETTHVWGKDVNDMIWNFIFFKDHSGFWEDIQFQKHGDQLRGYCCGLKGTAFLDQCGKGERASQILDIFLW